MSAVSLQNGMELTYENIKKLFRESKEPALTAGEVADEFGISNQAANYRLHKLQEEGDVVKKKVGGAAVIWWLEEGQDP